MKITLKKIDGVYAVNGKKFPNLHDALVYIFERDKFVSFVKGIYPDMVDTYWWGNELDFSPTPDSAEELCCVRRNGKFLILNEF